MSFSLSLSILDGALVGKTVDIPEGGCSLGGNGSGADIEVTGLPHGVLYVNFEASDGNKWKLVEFKRRTSLLNDKYLRRRNYLRNKDEISLPSLIDGQNIRFSVILTPIKRETPQQFNFLKGIKPAYVFGSIAYLGAFLIAGILYWLYSESDGTDETIQFSLVEAAVAEDIQTLRDTLVSGSPQMAIGQEIRNFSDIQTIINSDLSEEEKEQLIQKFKTHVLMLFSEAWAYERRERWDEARKVYLDIQLSVSIIRDLETTELALFRYNRIRNLGD